MSITLFTSQKHNLTLWCQDKTRQKDVVKQVHNGKNEQTEKYLRFGT